MSRSSFLIINSASLCFSVNVVILVLLAVAFLIIVQRNLLNLSDFLHKESPGICVTDTDVCVLAEPQSARVQMKPR